MYITNYYQILVLVLFIIFWFLVIKLAVFMNPSLQYWPYHNWPYHNKKHVEFDIESNKQL